MVNSGSTPPLPSRRPVIKSLVDICGPGFARHARPTDVVAGRPATFVAVPATDRAIADLMGLAAARGLAVRARGSGSKIDWGTPPAGVDLLLDTARMSGLWDLSGLPGSGLPDPGGPPPDFSGADGLDGPVGTVEVGTGTPVRALRAALALRRLRLAADPPSASATVGGMLAVNESGPLRHRFGLPAAQVDAVTYVDRAGAIGRSDGEDGRPGIAEIDGVLTSATLRVRPLPTARSWVIVPVSTPLQVHNLVEETLALGLTPSGVEVDLPVPTGTRLTEQPPGSLAVLIEGDALSVGWRAERLTRALGPGATTSATAPPWWGRYPFRPSDVVLRLGVGVADLHAAVYALSDACGGPVALRGSAGSGMVHAVLPGALPAERIRSITDAVRQVLMGRSGRAVVLTAPPAVARLVDMAAPADLA